MATKNIDKCIKEAFDNEDLFVLMTRDHSAPFVIIDWIRYNINVQPPEKLHEALDTAIRMVRNHPEILQQKYERQRERKRQAKIFPDLKDSEEDLN